MRRPSLPQGFKCEFAGDLPYVSIGSVRRTNPSFQATDTSFGATHGRAGHELPDHQTSPETERAPARMIRSEVVSMFRSQGHRDSGAAPEPIPTPPRSRETQPPRGYSFSHERT